MSKILVVTNDTHLEKNLRITLAFSGFSVHLVSEVSEAWEKLSEIHFDMLLLDLDTKNQDVYGFSRSLRDHGSRVPLLFFGENSIEKITLREMDLGSYDLILKPFKFRELKRKMNDLLVQRHERLIFRGDLRIDVINRIIKVKDRMVSLGTMEAEILILLARKKGMVFSPEKIQAELRSKGSFLTMTFYYHLSRLRKKLKEVSGEALQINMVDGIGYRLDFE